MVLGRLLKYNDESTMPKSMNHETHAVNTKTTGLQIEPYSRGRCEREQPSMNRDGDCNLRGAEIAIVLS